MTLLVNRAKMTTATTGTGVITLGSAVSGYQSFGAAGVTNGSTVSYVIEDNGNWEIGGGVYTATGTTLSRTPVQSSNAGAAIALSGSAVVYVAAIASDIVPSSGGTFSGGVTVNGTMNATTLAIGGTSITSTAEELNFVSDVTSLIQAQLNGKAPLTGAGTSGTWGISISGNAATATSAASATSAGTLTGLTSTIAELNFVDDVTSLIQAQLNGKAPLASPALTGTPTAPTAAVGTNTTQLATTAFVNAEIANDITGKADLASPALTGTPTAPTAAVGTNTTQLATTAFVNAEIANDITGKADLASPALTGTPTAPTAVVGTNTTQLATTAFVNAEIANDAPTKTGTGASGTWGISVTGSSGSTTGNAATATTLQTARAINGVSFNGSADITVADSTKLPLSGGTVTGDITMSGTGMIKVPLGTTAQRPVTPATGMIRFNSTRSCFEGYNGTGWVNLSPVLFDDIGAIA